MSVYMNYEGIEGETTDANHAGWMDIEHLSWGTSRNISSASSTSTDRESANASITDLNITRSMDSATPALFIESCCGKGKTVIVELCKTGEGSGSDTYMQYTLTNALISNYTMTGQSDSNARPVEHITISFQDVEVKYTPYDDDNNALSPLTVGFDTTTNTKR